MLNLFDGARRPLSASKRVLIRLRDGAGRMVWEGYRRGPSIYFTRLPVHGNFRDNYTVIATAPRCLTTGFTPVHVAPEKLASLDLMLLPRDGSFDFRSARWTELERARPQWIGLLEQERYERLMEERPAAIACLLNILTALEQIQLGGTVALEYLAELMWDPQPAPDRIFAWAGVELLESVKRAVEGGQFTIAALPGALHPGATDSFRETRYPVGNVQLTFHGRQRTEIAGRECLKLESDIDYYRDPAAHVLLEVLPNTLLGRISDPRVAYMLRWTATRRLGLPEFAPPYTIG